ncbi:PREDICTED: ATP-dependent 6-phosphofructokinase 3-like [Nelumbo nucifera]|uniref:ATP-dependent 6-phosphofructokinase 3-like n=1 Tax=Nelumbo nucifera TaxID=4432 RepID=A0A1U8Q760_NELNU|nr:PREDICTED: ATP-dependent 6-phosphofructokinase 3-like [Nelumbo nucifera]
MCNTYPPFLCFPRIPALIPFSPFRSCSRSQKQKQKPLSPALIPLLTVATAIFLLIFPYFVDIDDTVPQKIVVHKTSPREIHFRRVGPRQKIYFESDEMHACIVTCTGLCPGLNTVIREIVCGLNYMYGVSRILGIENEC